MPTETISLCMVVKDEETTLAAAVESCRSFIDEIVIGVDDSCTDKTPEIAQQLASPGKLFFFKWNNNFAEARNEAIKRCSSSLIFILDGHELIPPDDHPTAEQLARMRHVNIHQQQTYTPRSFFEQVREKGMAQDFEVICCTLAMNTDEAGIPQLFFLQPRIFRNNGQIKYNDAVHNYLVGYESSKALGCPEGVLIHNMPPAREAMRKKQRAKMNIQGLYEDYCKNKDDARPLFYLGNSYADMGKPNKAIYWYERYLGKSRFEEEKYQVYQQLSLLYYRHLSLTEKNAEKKIAYKKKAKVFTLEGIMTNWRRSEPFIFMAEMCLDDKDFEQAIHWLNLAENIDAPPTVMFLQGAVYSYMPAIKKMICYEGLSQWDKALECAEISLTWRPHDAQIIEKLLTYKRKINERDSKEKNLLIVDKIGSFTEDIRQHLSKRFNVVRRVNADDRWRAWADFVWFEWCDDNILEASFYEWPVPIICRLHSYEAFTDLPGRVNWQHVDHLIFVAEHIRQLVFSKWPFIKEQVDTSVIENGIDPSKFTFKKRDHGKRIGYLGYLNPKKGIELLVEAMRTLPNYEFHIAGQFQDEHLAYYFQNASAELPNFYWHGWIDPMRKDEWLENVDYLISTSIVESFGYSLAEAMLKGIKPLIHERPGVIWPETFRTITDLKKLLAGDYNSAAYRQHIIERFSLDGQLARTDTIVDLVWEAKEKKNRQTKVYEKSALATEIEMLT